MSKSDSLQGRAMQLAGQIGDGLRNVPDHAQKWFKAGLAVGAARAGGTAIVRTTRRHPALTAAAATALATAAGLLVYAYRRRKASEAEGAVISGRSTRVEPRRSAAARASGKSAGRRSGEEQAPEDPAED